MSPEHHCWAGEHACGRSGAQACGFSIAQRANLVCAGKDDSLKHDCNDLTPPNK